jgi:hypothetical protein
MRAMARSRLPQIEQGIRKIRIEGVSEKRTRIFKDAFRFACLYALHERAR